MADELSETIKKVAVGFSLEEVTEEYGVTDGEVRLVKRKETKKDVPPDLRAVKMLLDGFGREVSEMTDEELKAERAKLLAELKESEKGGEDEE